MRTKVDTKHKIVSELKALNSANTEGTFSIFKSMRQHSSPRNDSRALSWWLAELIFQMQDDCTLLALQKPRRGAEIPTLN